MWSMTAKSVLERPHGLRTGTRAPTCPLATPLGAEEEKKPPEPTSKNLPQKLQLQ